MAAKRKSAELAAAKEQAMFEAEKERLAQIAARKRSKLEEKRKKAAAAEAKKREEEIDHKMAVGKEAVVIMKGGLEERKNILQKEVEAKEREQIIAQEDKNGGEIDKECGKEVRAENKITQQRGAVEKEKGQSQNNLEGQGNTARQRLSTEYDLDGNVIFEAPERYKDVRSPTFDEPRIPGSRRGSTSSLFRFPSSHTLTRHLSNQSSSLMSFSPNALTGKSSFPLPSITSSPFEGPANLIISSSSGSHVNDNKAEYINDSSLLSPLSKTRVSTLEKKIIGLESENSTLRDLVVQYKLKVHTQEDYLKTKYKSNDLARQNVDLRMKIQHEEKRSKLLERSLRNTKASHCKLEESVASLQSLSSQLKIRVRELEASGKKNRQSSCGNLPMTSSRKGTYTKKKKSEGAPVKGFEKFKTRMERRRSMASELGNGTIKLPLLGAR